LDKSSFNVVDYAIFSLVSIYRTKNSIAYYNKRKLGQAGFKDWAQIDTVTKKILLFQFRFEFNNNRPYLDTAPYLEQNVISGCEVSNNYGLFSFRQMPEVKLSVRVVMHYTAMI